MLSTLNPWDSPFGRLLGQITLHPSPASVPAGDLMLASPPDPGGSPPRFWKFLVTSDHLTDIGIYSGDAILIDSDCLDYLKDEDCHGLIVLVRCHCGLFMGRVNFQRKHPAIEMLDGTRRKLLWTPEMEIVGVMHHLYREPHWDQHRSTFS